MSTETMEPTVAEIARSNPRDTENFAKWIGIDPETLKDAPDSEADATDDPTEPSAESSAEPVQDSRTENAEPTPEPASPDPDTPAPIALPFEAMADEAPVDATLLANMKLTFKANGKTETLPLADVVRRAQSEPAIQQQAWQLRAAAEKAQQEVAQRASELEQVRAIALRMARDPDFHATVTTQLEQYDAPESRAERAEAALAAERQRQQDTQQQQQFQEAVTRFGTEVLAPTLNELFTKYPTVNPQEVLGQFTADTQPITRNGIIPPEYHEQLAGYLRGPLMEFAKARHDAIEAEKAKIAAEVRKTQIERQKMKNQAAAVTKPFGSAPGLRDTPAPTRPTTYKEAEKNALRTLLGDVAA